MFMLYWNSRVKSVLVLNIAYFPTLLSENVNIGFCICAESSYLLTVEIRLFQSSYSEV